MRTFAFLVALAISPLAVASDLRVGSGGAVRSLELRDLEIRVSIDERIATTRVREVFANDSDEALEGVYVFPVPPGAALTAFAMTAGNRRLVGTVAEKARATAIYDSYRERRVDPALLEHVEKNLFRVRVFPIAPRSAVEVELAYREVVPYDHGECRYVHPLATSSRPGAVAGRFLLAAEVRSTVPIRDAGTEGGFGEVVHRGDRACAVAFEGTGVALDHDIVVRWRLAGEAPRLTWLAHRPDPSADGWFLLVLSPQEELGSTRPPLDVVYVVDVSGSMAGPKVEQARRALRYSVGSLAPEDRFEIVAFSTSVERFAGTLVPADAAGRGRAQEYVSKLEARGGTALDQAIRTALAAAGREPGRQRVVVLLSDGQPSIGESNPARILEHAAEAAAPGTRIHTFGIGTPAEFDRDVLAALSSAHGGSHLSVAPQEAIEVALAKFQDELAHPSIGDLAIDWGGADVRDVQPLRLRPLVRGRQIHVLGRYAAAGRHRVVVRGLRGDEPVTLEAEVDLPEREPDHAGLAPLWAAETIESLRYEMFAGRPSPELEQEIVRLALEHRLATPWTSFLVLENEGEYRRWNLEPGEDPKAEDEKSLAEYRDAMDRAKNAAVAAMDQDQRLHDLLADEDPTIRDLARELEEYRTKVDHLRRQGIQLEAGDPGVPDAGASREERVAGLTREVEAYASRIEHLRAQGIDVARLAETKVPSALDARIVATHAGVGLVMLDRGEAHGVEKGMSFTVYRGDAYVGQVIVEEVFPDMASARIDTRFQKQEVREGDDLTTRLERPVAIPRSRGRVLAVDSAEGRVVIDLGSNAGVAAGAALTVHRGPTHVGRILVEEVQPDRSIARLEMETLREDVREGDEVEVAGR